MSQARPFAFGIPSDHLIGWNVTVVAKPISFALSKHLKGGRKIIQPALWLWQTSRFGPWCAGVTVPTGAGKAAADTRTHWFAGRGMPTGQKAIRDLTDS